ncbi:MAG: DUF4260 domain-containing protein [Chloroflexi bacterium]|nr:DUF4260 domain-containing protein [Chloroflexota bacterium]
MKNLIRLEQLFLVILSIYLFSTLEYAWWWYAILFLTPDLSMAGYLAGPRVGAVTYNLVHHKGVAVALYVAGALLGSQPLQLAGVILLGHSSFDRVFGYGLKYPDSFQHTSLGMIGKAKTE